jgi:nucleotide-binding universal stress UspA family protein
MIETAASSLSGVATAASAPFERIVVGYDDSAGAEDALALAELMGAEGADRVVVTVLPERRRAGPADEAAPVSADAVEAKVRDAVDGAAERIAGRGMVVASTSPARGLQEVAERLGADLIVLGSRDGKGRVRAARVATRLLHGAPCAVAVAPSGYCHSAPALHVIGVGLNGSRESTAALRAAIGLGLRHRSTLRLMAGAATANAYWGYGSWGYGFQELGEAAIEAARLVLQEAVADAPSELRPSTLLFHGPIAQQLAAEAEKGVDLLCVGSRRYGPVRRVLLGSVSTELLQAAPCPVLVLPRVDAGGDADA